MDFFKRLLDFIRRWFAPARGEEFSQTPSLDAKRAESPTENQYPAAPTGQSGESQSDAAAQSQPLRRSNRGERNVVIVGFDFGTHSTKVLFRRRREDVAHVLTMDSPVDGYPAFAAPSLVRFADDRLWFGREALLRTGGHLYRSLKVRLLGPSAEKDESDYPVGPAPDHLVACFLAWAFRIVRKTLTDEIRDPDIRINLAAPMDHLEDDVLKLRYLQIAHAAWQIAFGYDQVEIDQGVRFSEISDSIAHLLAAGVADESERRFDVLPETVAPIVSLSMNPRTEPGMYLVVDIGAGTTEMSINNSTDPRDHRVVCYFDKSERIGGDQLSRIDRLPTAERKNATQRIVENLMRLFGRVWAEGYKKDSPRHATRKRWRELTVLLTGGGARHPAVKDPLAMNRSHYQAFLDEAACHVVWHSPDNVDLADCKQAAADIPLLAVAHGLTRERMEWPIVFEPGCVETLAATETVDKPDPFHYVGGK